MPVTADACAGKLWRAPDDFGFARAVGLVPLVAAELPAAQAEFPILLERGPSGLGLVAITLAKGHDSRFVDRSGAWRARYTPFLLRYYPFARAGEEAGGGLVVYCDPQVCGSAVDGDWFYDDEGVRNPVLDQIEEDLARFAAARADTAAALRALDEAGVLEPFDPARYAADLRVEGGELLQVDEARLKSLPAEAFMALRDADAIPVAYCHLLSLQHLAKLQEKHAEEPVWRGAAPDPEKGIESIVRSVEQLIEERNPYSAASIVRRARKRYKDSAELGVLEASLLSMAGKDDLAQRVFTRLAEEERLDERGQRAWVAAFLRADRIPEAQNLMAAIVPPTEAVAQQTPAEARAWSALHLELAARQGQSDPDLVTLAQRLVAIEPRKAMHHVNLAALTRDSQEARLHTQQALALGGEDPDVIYRCVTELGVADPAHWLWRACAVRPLTLSSAKAYRELRKLLPETHKPLHERIVKIWSRYSEEELKVTFGDYGLPYQAFEPLLLPGSRPTLPRLEAYGLREHAPKGARALDIGCNHGFLLLGLQDHLSQGEGFDISKACVEIGNAVAEHIEAPHIALRHKTYEQFLETEPEPFDLVIACAVHRWIGAPLEQLDTVLRRVVKPGGLVLIESQGQRSPKRLEPGFHEKIDALIARGLGKVHDGTLCDDGINARAFYLLRMT